MRGHVTKGFSCQCRIVAFAHCLPSRHGGRRSNFENNLTSWKLGAPNYSHACSC